MIRDQIQIILVVQEQTYYRMQATNQHNYPVFYYPPYQNGGLLPTHLTQARTNVHIYQRADNNHLNKTMEMNRMYSDPEIFRNKIMVGELKPDHNGIRHQFNRVQMPQGESSVCKYPYFQNMNPENNNRINKKVSIPYKSTSPLKDTYTFQIKRKQSKNKIIKEVNEDQFIDDQQKEDLLSRLPQLHLNQNSRPRQLPQYRKKFNNENKYEQNVSPMKIHIKPNSLQNQNFFQAPITRKIDSLDIDERNNGHETQRFNSPRSQLNPLSGCLKTHKSIHCEEFNSPQNVHSQGNLDNTSLGTNELISLNSHKQISKSFGASTVESSKQFRDSGFSVNLSVSTQDKGIQVQITVNQQNEQINNLKNTIQQLQKQLQAEKSQKREKELKFKERQHQLQILKTILAEQLEQIQRKQIEIRDIRQENDQFIAKMIADVCEKSKLQLKEIESRFQSMISNVKKECQDIKGKAELQKNQLLAKIEQLLAESSSKHKFTEQKQISTDFVSSKQQQLSQKVLSLEASIINMSKGSDKQNQKILQYESQLRKSNRIIMDNESYMKCMIKDFNKDSRTLKSEINQLKKLIQCMSKINEGKDEQIMKLAAKNLQTKYRIMEDDSNY